MKNKYDVVIVGAGPMGIFTAYELILKAPEKSVLLIEQGHDIYHRYCPIKNKRIEKCPVDIEGNSGCLPCCSITCGFGGAGAFSDGKFNITSEFGGWMQEYVGNEEVIDLIKYVDAINLKHGAPEELTDPQSPEVFEIEKRAVAAGLKLLRSEVRHLGTEVNLKVLQNIYEEMKGKIDYAFETKVNDILVVDDKVTGVVLAKGEPVYADYVVFGVGRTGSTHLAKILKKHGVNTKNNRVDIGVRVETNDIVMEEINRVLYEGKFIYNTTLGTQTRTFCSNPSGHVVVENHHGIMTCNGHSYHDAKLGSKNTNFAILVSHEFDEPFNESNAFAEQVSQLANMLSNGSVIVQKYGDILKGRRSTKKRIEEGFVIPTLKEAVPGDLGLALPYNTLKSVIEMIEALNYVTPGIASDHTLLYGVEAKFYSDRIDVKDNFETKAVKNLFVGGDGAGITRGLAQAGANGVHIARTISKR